ncbi:hypothetical protein QJS10_CPB14g01344 [Acorus calamus]|uniref:DUF4408 domain-containing protein n=1 Tax=Acorus calamus TaxID=4465 RepID=A0AAV9DD64_ACOCL|nr:hypothetical protein QJS10_CPB14g01356 [Acorus calamus]KAK1298970.1 hypothetical protein QJS10_CPB14g01344 [Acorus calamus]
MKKFMTYEFLKVSILIAFIVAAPLVSESMRVPYLYLFLNFLIIALGAESGVLAKPSVEKKPINVHVHTPIEASSPTTNQTCAIKAIDDDKPKEEKAVMAMEEKPVLARIVSVTKVRKAPKRCPSIPSLFFIGGCHEDEPELVEEEEEVYQDVRGELSGQELFAKAEMFIGDFYKQLKMQREESWKKIHGFYHKTF